MYIFGAGNLWATPITDVSGNLIATPTPVLLATLQEFSLDISYDRKELYGQYQFPLEVAAGKAKLSCKAKYANVGARALDVILFGQGVTAGEQTINFDVAGQLVPATPFAITITPPNAGTMTDDLGVRDVNGIPLTRVTGTPASGQYVVSVATKTYTFSATDTGKRVYISYAYSTATGGFKQTVINQLMGQMPKFRADYFTTYGGKRMAITLLRCSSDKLGLASKLDDFLIPEMEFSAMADTSGNVFSWSMIDP